MAIEDDELIEVPTSITVPTINVVAGGALPEQPKSVPYSGGAETARAALGGLTFGFGDELEAGVRAPFSDENYTQIRDKLRAQNNEYAKDYPIVSTVADVAGGIALPFGLAGSAFKAGKGLYGAAKAGALGGAASGAITGAGVAEEMGDIPANAAGFGALGAVTGGVVAPVAKLGGGIIKNMIDSAGFSNANKVASKKVQEYLAKEDLTPAQAFEVLEEFRRLGVPSPVLADLGDNLRGLGFAAASIPSSSKTGTSEFLENRNKELVRSLIYGLEQKSGIQSDGKFGFDYIEDLIGKQQSAARAKYPKAYSIDVPAAPFRKYADRDLFKNAYDEAVKFADIDGVKLPPLEQLRNAQSVNTELLHQIKIGLDSVIDKEVDAFGKMSKYGAKVNTVKNEFNNLLKYYNKPYAQANKEFADSSAMKTAYQKGLNYQKIADLGELSSKLKAMTGAEKEAFRVGMLSGVKNSFGTFKGNDATRLVFSSDTQKKALKYAFDSEEMYEQFVKQVDAQKQLLRTSNKVLGGSPTIERKMVSQDAAELDFVSDMATGNIFGAATKLGRNALTRASGVNANVADEMQSMLFNQNPTAQKEFLNLLQEKAINPDRFSKAGGIGGLLGQQGAALFGK
jgi:hypothetical protein